MGNLSEIYKYFNINIINKLQVLKNQSCIEEIRVRVNCPIILKSGQDEIIIDYIISEDEILNIFQRICNNSVYSFQNQIINGFITVQGGHRVGIAGNVVVQENNIININYISSLNFRIAKEIIGCSDNILKYILDCKNSSVYNTLIVSPPGSGKTTIIRDLIRNLSNNNFSKFLSIGVADERNEISAMYNGVPQNNLGIRTDILNNAPKAIAMKMMVRSMAPEIIVADEIGSKQDMEAITYAMRSGVKGIFTAHGYSINDIYLNPILNELLEYRVFDNIIFLDKKIKSKVNKIFYFNIELNKYEESTCFELRQA